MGRVSVVPSFTLSQCFDDVLKLYSQYSHASFKKAEIASTLGFSASSGPFGTRMASIKMFGLLQTDGQNYRITEEFKKMRIADRNSVEFKTMAMDLLRNSELFAEILEEFKHKLPSKNTLAQRLEIQKKMNPQKAGSVATIFIESLKFASALDENNNILPPRGDQTLGQPVQTQHSSPPLQQQSSSIPIGTLLSIDISLGDEKIAKVLYPPNLTKAQAQKISNVLNALVS